MAEILSTVGPALEAAEKFNKYVLTPIVHQFSYLCCYNSNVQSLRAQVEKLNQKRNNLKLEVEAAKRNAEVIGRDVEEWLEEVVKINEKKERIIQDAAQVQQGCFYGSCPNIKLRYRLSREAKKTTEAVAELLQVISKFRQISYPAALEPIPPASAGIEVDSRKSKEDEIMDALKDDKVYVVAVCGMGGVGKTTMAKKIQNRVREEKIFEEVVMAIASQQLDLYKVQQEIAEGLGLRFHEQTIPARAERLHKRLKNAKSVPIIVDDVWKKFNLQEIGIPSKTTHEGCKIILTSRLKHVCRDIEDSAKIIPLDVLPEQEAWNLFKEKAGVMVDDPNLLPIAMDVAKECKGLPLALVTVAAALRNSSIPSWKDAIHQLKRCMATDIPEVVEEVFVPLKWSYDRLRSKEARYLFLLCCLFPEDYEIPLDTLVRYGFGLRIFEGIENLTEARNRVRRLIEMLLDRFLLIRANLIRKHFWKYRVKMHDVIRDMAISIASKDNHDFLVSHDKNLREWPKKDFYDKYSCISLSLRNRISLPEKIYCPRLELLRMHSAEGLEIQESSLDEMRGLKVLDTCWIKSLPSSLPLLTNLRSLFLERSKLEILPNEIGELVNLEILSLKESSSIVKLPKEIGRLKILKSFDLTDCWSLKNIAPGVISGLVQLEELFMLESFQEWEAEGIENNNASVAEVASLTSLTTLQIRIPSIRSINLLEDSRNWHTLTRYYVVIGSSYDLIDCGKVGEISVPYFERCIKLRSHRLEWVVPWTHVVQVLFENAEVIELEGKGSSEIANKLSRDGYKNVERLVLSYQVVEFLFDSSSGNLPNTGFLSRATKLHLYSNDALKGICRGQPPAGSFSNLTSIKLESCNALENLFSFKIVAMLSKLEFLEICYCKIMEAVFFEQNGQFGNNAISSTITFPKLSEIKINNLPSLGAFCKATDNIAIELPQLHKVQFEGCLRLESFCTTESSLFPEGDHNAEQQFFFDQKVMCGGLKTISFIKSCKIGIFDPKIPIGNFAGLESLDFQQCSGCVNLFSNSVWKVVPNLKDLCVYGCEMLQEVIAEDKEEQSSSKVTLFSQLKKLELLNLPKMQQFCHMSHGIELPSLELLRINSCSRMETFSRNQPSSGVSDSNRVIQSFFDKVTCSKLKTLDLYDLATTTELFGHKISIGNFSGLQTVKISSGDRLRSIFCPPLLRGLMNLQVLQVSRCSMLQEVISEEEKEPLFPQLKELGLWRLPNLIRFCHIKDDLRLPSLEKVTILDCSRLKGFYTVESSTLPEGDRSAEQNFIFDQKVICSGLKTLVFKQMSCNIRIFDPRMRIGNFIGLESLHFEDCSGFVNLFSNFIWRIIPSLKDLYVKNCAMLQEVIAKDVEEQTSSRVTLFPQLKHLNLLRLRKMQQFCHVNRDIELPSLELLNIEDCLLMETFSRNPVNLPSSGVSDSNLVVQSFFDEVTCSKLKTLKLQHLNATIELFGPKISIGNFSGLETVKIDACERLRSIFSPPMFRGLMNLQVLKVNRCPMLQEVISEEDKEGETKINMFPQLRILQLWELPKLIRFCHIKHDLELPSLKKVFVTHCPVLETFSLGSTHLPSSVQISTLLLGSFKGLSGENFASKFFFNKQVANNEGGGTNINFSATGDGKNETGNHSH